MLDKDKVIVWGIRVGLVGLLVYLLLSFIFGFFNPYDWDILGRIALVTLTTAGIYLVNKVSNG